MANYRFNIPASGCTDKVIGSYPASDSGKITNFRFGEGIWNDVSISSAETGDAIEIYLKVGEYTETTSGRSIEDIDLFYDIDKKLQHFKNVYDDIQPCIKDLEKKCCSE